MYHSLHVLRNSWEVKESIQIVIGKVRNLQEIKNLKEGATVVANVSHRGYSNEGLEVFMDILIDNISNEELSSSL